MILKLPRISAYMWYCGDEWCNCTQPVIEYITQNEKDARFVRREQLWVGDFVSDASADEYQAQWDEMGEAVAMFVDDPEWREEG